MEQNNEYFAEILTDQCIYSSNDDGEYSIKENTLIIDTSARAVGFVTKSGISHTIPFEHVKDIKMKIPNESEVK